jgi:hypothetical protein
MVLGRDEVDDLDEDEHRHCPESELSRREPMIARIYWQQYQLEGYRKGKDQQLYREHLRSSDLEKSN